MNAPARWAMTLLLASGCAMSADERRPKVEPYKPSTVSSSSVVPPRVSPPCKPGRCPFAGQRVTMLIVKEANAGALGEMKDEFEAATGATLNLVQMSHQDLFPNFLSDLTNQTGKYDAAYAGAWWLGELVAGGYIVPYDKYYKDPRFPKWNVDDVLPAPRSLLSYEGRLRGAASTSPTSHFGNRGSL